MTERHRTVFRGLVIGEWALIVLLQLGAAVPPEVQERASRSFATNPRPFLLFLAIACSFGLLKIAAAVGLLVFKRWGRPLFAIGAVATVLSPFLPTLLPPELARLPNPPLAASVAALLSVMDGAILALAYAGPIRGLFSSQGDLAARKAEGAG